MIRMAKKYIILFTALIFFLRISPAGLCLTTSPKITPNCCPNKGPSSESGNCFSHCTKQKLDIIKIERHLGEDLKTRTPLFLDNKSFHNLQSYLSSPILLENHYLNQAVSKLNISQVYFMATFNHAPPLSPN